MDRKLNSDVFCYRISNKARFAKNNNDLVGLRFHHIEHIQTDKTVKILNYPSSLVALHNDKNIRMTAELCRHTTYNLIWDDYYSNMTAGRTIDTSYDDYNNVELEDYIESENRMQNRKDGYRC